MKNIFASIIPAPNPTGHLHMGHFLNLCLQDAFCRWKKFTSHEVFWLAGVDHGATSTQDVVTKEHQKTSRLALTDNHLAKKLDQWITLYSDIIFDEFSAFRLCVDSKDKVTMHSEKFTNFAQKFVNYLERERYIYWDKVVVPWSYRLRSSTDAVDYMDSSIPHNLYSCRICNTTTNQIINFQLENLAELVSIQGIILNDSHSEPLFINDIRLNKLIGSENLPVMRFCKEPYRYLTTGNFSPSHNKKHYEIAIENNIDIHSNVSDDGTIIQGDMAGLNLNDHKSKIVLLLKNAGVITLITQSEKRNKIYRLTGEPLNYHYTQQKLLSVHKLASSARETIESNKLRIEPLDMKELILTLIERAESRQQKIVDSDWPIQRRLVSGTAMPQDSTIKSHSASTYTLDMRISCSLWAYFAHQHYANPDLPFEVLARNAVCITGNDLVPFWIFPIILLSTTQFLPLPFSTVIAHPLICDKQGNKMSKSIGNVISPMKMIDKYGLEAIRIYTFIKLPEDEHVLKFDEEELLPIVVWIKKFKHVLTTAKAQQPNNKQNDVMKNILDSIEAALDNLSALELGHSVREMFNLISTLRYHEGLNTENCVRAKRIFNLLTGNNSREN